MIPSPKEVFDNPSRFWRFLTQSSDDDFEDQHFDRKQASQIDESRTRKRQLNDLRNHVKKTISAFANSNVEGGLLILGIASNGSVEGIDHLSEEEKNSFLNFASFLHYQAAETKFHRYRGDSRNHKTICLIFVPYTDSGICETPGQFPKAWLRSGPQNVQMTQERRDHIRTTKGLLDFEGMPCCPFNAEEVSNDVLAEFKKVFHPDSTRDFGPDRLLFEAGAIIKKNDEDWFTHAGLLFFGVNPQRVLSQSYIRLVRFPVSSDQFQAHGLPTLDKSFMGPLTKQIREARVFFRESGFFKRYQKRKFGGGFVEEQEFPPTVIDEAIVNAVTHRDYRTGIPIECESYSDAFLVKNPGRMLQRNTDLPNEFSLSDRVLNSMPRNSKLIEWLRRMKDPDGTAYVQAISEGTKQMLSEMRKLGLPAPYYRLSENETLIKLENNAVEREAAMFAASQVKSTEFSNLFLLKIRRDDEPVGIKAFKGRYREIVKTLRDALMGNGWFIDRFGHSRIVAHKKGVELAIPGSVRSLLRIYPAYEFQIRQYFESFYLCLDYKCEILNVQKLSDISRHIPKEKFIDRRCVAKLGRWREGRIMEFNVEFAKIHFLDTEEEEQVPVDAVIPSCSITMIKESLQRVGVAFDLSTAIKKHSLASRPSAARERVEKVTNTIQYIIDNVFPIQLGDLEIRVLPEPLQLVEHVQPTEYKFPVYRIAEPTVEFREHHTLSDVRDGITKYGAYETDSHEIEIVPVCVNSERQYMEDLINRLKVGKYKYRGSERTFATRFSYPTVVTVEHLKDIRGEIERLLSEHSDWIGDSSLKRIFFVHTPEKGYSRDDHDSPYYVIKRILLEKGVPCQMVNTSTLQNPDWKDLNLALNITAKCGVKPWVLPDAIPNADFFIGLSYTQSGDGKRVMGSANVFNSYGKWEFYSGNTSYFDFEVRTRHLARLVEATLTKLQTQLTPNPQIVFHYSSRLSKRDRDSILAAARKIRPEGIYTFVWINTHHNVRFYDNRPESDGSLRRGSYVAAAKNKIYLSTTGYNPYRKVLGTPKPLEVSAWVHRPEGLPETLIDLRALAVQVLSLTKLNWASTDSFCGEPITLKYAGEIAYLTAAFLRQSEPFKLHPVLEKTPWFI